jgi:hypothetical protein
MAYLHQCWFQLVEVYTGTGMTKSSDRTAAILGIVLAIQRERKEFNYLAGLWSHHLLYDLLWCLAEDPKPRPTEPRAPSWSWMAIDGRVCQRLWPFTLENKSKMYEVKLVAEVCKSAVIESQQHRDTLVLVYEGHLDLLCRVLQVRSVVIRPSDGSNCKSTIMIAGPRRTFTAAFVPDFMELSIPSTGLCCVEILRITDGYGYGLWRPSQRIHGIVLRPHPGGEISPERYPCYERIGRFWVEMKTFGDFTEFEPFRRIRIK